MMEAFARGDKAVLERLLADDFVLTSATSAGELLTKRQYIDGGLNLVKVESFRFHDFKIRSFGDTAIVNCRIDWKSTWNGQPWSADFLMTDVWRKHRDNHWRIVTRHSSYPASKATAPANADEAAIRQALQHYLQAHVTGNPEHLHKAFSPEARLSFVRDGKLTQMTLEEYVKRFSGQPAEDEAQRRRTIEGITVNGNAAAARITFDYPATLTTDFMLLLKVDGEWKIVQKSFYVGTKPK
jgi:ketosteroid isomerase-like protein